MSQRLARSGRHPLWRPSAVLAAAGVVAALGLAPPAAGQSGSGPDSPVPSSSPAGGDQARDVALVVEATLRVYRLRGELADLDRRLVDVGQRLVEAEKALAETERKLTAARLELFELRARLQARAAIVYQRHSDRLSMALSVDRVVNLSAGNHYAESVATVDNDEIDRLGVAIAALEIERDQREAARRELADTKDRLERERVDLQAAIDRESEAISRLGGVPVMGPSVLNGAELAAYFRSTGQRARLMGTTTIEELAEMYVSEGAAENVRGDLAFAQAILETGSFGNAADNNFAGIGACDSCSSQYLFPTPRDGVRAQIQLLRNYADPLSRASQLTNPLDATLHGTDPVRAAYTFDSFSFKGRAPLWNVMGAGNWATDPLYAGKILNIYARMLAFKTAQSK